MNETTEKTYELSSVELAEDQVLDAYTLEELANEVMEIMSEATDEEKCRRLEVVTQNTQAESRVYENYSGRGMYGRKCVGISTENPMEVIELAAQYGITGAKTDSLGTATIVYWPKVAWVEE